MPVGSSTKPFLHALRSLDRLILLLAVTAAPVRAAEQATPVISADAFERASFTVSDAIATGTFGPLDGVAGRPNGWTIDVASPGRRLWSVQLAIPLSGPVATGDTGAACQSPSRAST
jgi:hypothetical protein